MLFRSSSVVGVIAQRLVRRICPKCKRELEITPHIERVLNIYEADHKEVTLYKGEGCPNCKDTGYKGRIALFEVMIISDAIREVIANSKNANTQKLREIALKEGMCSLKEDGMKKVREGITTIEEILRVAPD